MFRKSKVGSYPPHDGLWTLRAFLILIVNYLYPVCIALFALWLAWRVGFLPSILGLALAISAIGIAIFSGISAVKAAFGGVAVDLRENDPVRIGRFLYRLWEMLFIICLGGTMTTCTSASGPAIWNGVRNFLR